jgi:flavorubredoxin
MVVNVLFHSMTGNTKKIAEAIAREVGTSAEKISDETSIGEIDVLFIGDGNYGSNIHSKTRQCILRLENSKIKNVAIFGTYGGINTAVPKMKELLQTQGLHVVDDGFACKGKTWWIINRKHPTETDIAAARAFARQIMETCQQDKSD